MTTYVGADEAARLLGVTKASLYAYVSRGLVERRAAVDGRTSLYPREAVEALAARRRRRPAGERPTIDVRITTSITELDDEGVRYRGIDTAELARTSTFESVAELLWTGALPETPPTWPVESATLQRALDATAGVRSPLLRLAIAATVLDAEPGAEGATGATCARRLLAIAPTVLGGPRRGSTAARLARAWSSRGDEQLAAAIDRALVLLADHELATSTLAVRVAASARTDAPSALATGLHVAGGALHGAAATGVVGLFERAHAIGAESAVGEVLSRGERLAGFGHSVYRRGDPRLDPLLDAVRAVADPRGRIRVVDEVLVAVGTQVAQPANVDFALGALLFVAGLPRDAPIFAVARVAGWAAHYAEELGERPVRFRGLATQR